MTNLRPFDLEAAKAGAPVITRDGRPARIVCWDGESALAGKQFSLVALLGEGAGQIPGLFDVSGVCINGNHHVQLFMAPKPKRKVMVPECWVWKENHEAAQFVEPADTERYIHIPAHEVEVEE